MANLPQNPYVDGWLGSEREITVIPAARFPFANNPTPDKYARIYDRRYEVLPRLFMPKIANRTSWTNLVTYSQDVTNAAWTKTNATPTIVATPVAPDGSATLNKILETSATGEHSASNSATAAASPTEVSVFAQTGLNRDWIKLMFTDSGSTAFSAYFNATSGYIGTVAANTTAKIVPLGDGQFRCSIAFTPAAGSGTIKINMASADGTVSYPGDTAKGLYVWGLQVMTGIGPTPYASTTSATRTLSAPDVDKTDPLAFLAEEQDPNEQTSQSSIVLRKFARVPQQQSIPSSISLVIPIPSGGSVAAVQKQIASGVTIGITNATIINGQLFYQDAISQASVGQINQYPYFDSEVAVTSADSGANLRITWNSHGVTTQDIEVASPTQPAGYLSRTVIPKDFYTVVDSNTIDWLGHAGGAVNLAAKKIGTIIPRTAIVRCKLVTNYYLPGVTPGIATLDDIPLPTDQSNPAAFFAALIAGGTINYQVGQWKQWLASIAQQTTTLIDANDVQ